MAAEIRPLRTRADRQRAEAADVARQLILELADVESHARAQVLAALDAQVLEPDPGWVFVMIQPTQFRGVQRWLKANSTRKSVAADLWPEIMCHLVRATGEIARTRQELAALIDASPRDVSRVMSELEAIGAVIKHRDGRTMRYFVNPKVATNLPEKLRRSAQAAAPEVDTNIDKAAFRVISGDGAHG